MRSGPGDVDLVIYSLRKFCRLARQGNPSILVLLWLPKHIIKTDLGGELLGMRQCFFSREAGERFLGYLVSQKKALTGERAPKVARPELVERFGYDTKFAMHALRLGFQGIEYLTERRISEPVREPDRTTLLAVRRGEVGFAEALRLIEDAEARLRALVNECTARAGNEQIDRFLIRAHYTHWLYKSGG